MFRFSDSKTATCAAGEPILFEFQDCDWTGAARSLLGRSFTLTIYDDTGSLATIQSQTISDASGDFARFLLDGSTSDGLRGRSNIYLDLAERFHPGDDQLISAALTVTRAAPITTDFTTGVKARYIQRVKRLFDPVQHAIDPVYSFAFETFYSSGVASASTNLAGDFGSADNTIFYNFI